jgi:2-keto-3-deoxy-L-rhamnonate aldolase RhmA
MNKATTLSRGWKNPSYVNTEGSASLAESLCRGNRLRRLVSQGLALGTFVIDLPNPATLEVLSVSGFDFVVLDMEHSGIGISRLESLISAGRAAGLIVLVRTLGNDSALIGKVLDMGAHGVMAPHVDSPERAREVVRAARYSPAGNRGFSPLSKFDSLEEPLETIGNATYVIVQVEGKEALEHVEEIAATPGIDAVFIGPYDLSLSLGVAPGSPEVQAAAERVADIVPRHINLGIYIDDPADSGRWAAARFALQCVSFDGRMLARGARRVVLSAQQSLPEQSGDGEERV